MYAQWSRKPPAWTESFFVVITRMSSGGCELSTINKSLILQTDTALLTLPDPSCQGYSLPACCRIQPHVFSTILSATFLISGAVISTSQHLITGDQITSNWVPVGHWCGTNSERSKNVTKIVNGVNWLQLAAVVGVLQLWNVSNIQLHLALLSQRLEAISSLLQMNASMLQCISGWCATLQMSLCSTDTRLHCSTPDTETTLNLPIASLKKEATLLHYFKCVYYNSTHVNSLLKFLLMLHLRQKHKSQVHQSLTSCGGRNSTQKTS